MKSVLARAIKQLANAARAGKRQTIIRPASKVIVKVLQVMQKRSYIGEFQLIDDRRSGKIVVNLNGRLNKCAIISPRYDISCSGFEAFTKTLLPSRQFGAFILTTSLGIMDSEEAMKRNTGGKALCVCY